MNVKRYPLGLLKESDMSKAKLTKKQAAKVGALSKKMPNSLARKIAAPKKPKR